MSRQFSLASLLVATLVVGVLLAVWIQSTNIIANMMVTLVPLVMVVLLQKQRREHPANLTCICEDTLLGFMAGGILSAVVTFLGLFVIYTFQALLTRSPPEAILGSAMAALFSALCFAAIPGVGVGAVVGFVAGCVRWLVHRYDCYRALNIPRPTMHRW